MDWASFLGGLIGALVGAGATLTVGEGQRRRAEDTALLGWVTQLYDWVAGGTLEPDQVRSMLEGRRVTPRFWKLNRRYAARVNSVLDGLDDAFAPPEPSTLGGAGEDFELGEEE